MTSSNPDIQQRLRVLLGEYSQSDIARRTDTPLTSVNRYLAGGRIPAEFIGAVAREFNVSSAWLLLGEGAQDPSELSDGAMKLAGNMTSMAKAMSGVARMRLASLARKPQARALRELVDALGRFEEARDVVRKELSPVATEMLDSYRTALAEGRQDAAAELRGALEQVFRLHDDQDDLVVFHGNRAAEAFGLNEFETACEFSRTALFLQLTSGSMSDVAWSIAMTLCRALALQGRIDESVRIGRAVLAISSPDELRSPYAAIVKGTIGESEINLGNVRSGLRLIIEARAVRDPAAVPHCSGVWLRANFLLGTLSAEESLRLDLPGTSTVDCGIATWAETADLLKAAIARTEAATRRETSGRRLTLDHARELTKILRPRPAKRLSNDAYSEYIKLRAPFISFQAVVCNCHRDERAGRQAEARKLAKKAVAILEETPSNVTHSMHILAFHHRNVIRLFGKGHALRTQSEEFCRRAIEQGYGLFRQIPLD